VATAAAGLTRTLRPQNGPVKGTQRRYPFTITGATGVPTNRANSNGQNGEMVRFYGREACSKRAPWGPAGGGIRHTQTEGALT
jgi:hypothetical protein